MSEGEGAVGDDDADEGSVAAAVVGAVITMAAQGFSSLLSVTTQRNETNKNITTITKHRTM